MSKITQYALILMASSFATTVVAQTNLPARYKVIEIASPAGQLSVARATDLNDINIVALYRQQSADVPTTGYVFRPHLWYPSFEPFAGSRSSLSPPTGDTQEQSEGSVSAINDSNETVGWWKTWLGNNQYDVTKAIHWTSDRALHVVSGPSPNQGIVITATDINNSGLICGTTFVEGSEGVPGGSRPYTASAPNYTKAIFSSYPTYTVHGYAISINSDGWVSGHVTINNPELSPYTRGVLWTSSSAHEEVCPLGDLNNTWLEKYDKDAFGIGHTWKVVNGQPAGQRGFRWTSACDMELLPAGMDDPKDINSSGWVVGSSGLVPPKNYPSTGYHYYDLRSSVNGNVLDTAANTAGWQISPVAINSSGCIAGSGTRGGDANKTYAVLLVPTFTGENQSTTINIPLKLDRWKTTNPETNIQVTYRLQIGNLVVRTGQTATVTIPENNDTGTMSISSEYRGNIVLVVKGPKWLAKKITLTLPTTSSTTVTAAETLLLGGDANNDNVITTDDYLILNGSFDKSQGEAGYDDRADFDGDLEVTTDDYLILSDNFDVTGDQ